MWLGFCAVLVLVSPKVHDHAVGVLVEVSVKLTASGGGAARRIAGEVGHRGAAAGGIEVELEAHHVEGEVHGGAAGPVLLHT